jgi:hypothetical protein
MNGLMPDDRNEGRGAAMWAVISLVVVFLGVVIVIILLFVP